MKYLIIFLIWLLWASFSEGGLYKLQQMNPEASHKRSVEFLLSKLHGSESNRFWDSHHVKQCFDYMPNWSKAELCVRTRIYCESKAPQKLSEYSVESFPDIFSDEFKSCERENRPFLGPMEWLHGSRFLYRNLVMLGVIWISGGFNLKGQEAISYDYDNRYWLNSLMKWVSKGE